MYRLVGRLETSELSELYRARREDDGVSVVLKLFHPKTTDVAYAKVIADSAQRLAGVASPGLVRVLQVGTARRRLAIVREDSGRYTLGQALTRLNTREVVLPWAVALGFVIELAEVLEAAHQRGVVHGALTPGNVLLGHDGRALVADFGALSALLASPALKRAFGLRGRSSYRAPELRNAEAASVASDVYALGALAYELLTLKEASIAKDALPTRQAEKLPPPSRLVRRLNARIDPIVMRALEPLPARRFRSAAELADGLRECVAAQGGIPTRDDVRAFVDALFPKDVVVNALGPVPFDEPFALDDIAGVSDLVADLELEEAADARAPFSGGAVDERTFSSDGVPVLGEAAERLETQEVPAVAAPSRVTWDAPVADLPGPAAPPPEGEEISKRVRAVEDFGRRDELKTQESPAVARGPAPDENTERQKAKTLVNFVASFRRTSDVQPHDWRADEVKRKRAAITAVRWGAAILTLFTMGSVGLWLLTSGDPVGDLISWTPGPIEVELVKLRRPKSGPPGPPVPMPSVKLPDFDKPKPPPRLVEAPPTVQPAPPKSDCHVGPAGGARAFLTVTLKRPGRIEIDGDRVCGAASKVAVAPGKRLVRVVDGKTKQEWKTTVRFEAGKHAKLEPGFR